MAFPKKVKIVEVGPRDGLQNEKTIIPTETKINLINLLSDTGLSAIEVTSFVSPKRIPQLADGREVFAQIHKNPAVRYSVLVPNQQGMENAIQAGAKEIAFFTAASETFSKKNTECTIEESFSRLLPIIELAKAHHIPYRGYISCVLGCPYEGIIEPKTVASLAKRLYELGCYEISLGDTIGIGTPQKAKALIETVATEIPIANLAIHFHDTYGQALANIYACLQLGISVVDSAITGLGGCPYAKGASGNIATEEVVYLLQGLGIETGVDFDKLIIVSRFVAQFIQRNVRSKVAQALLNSDSL